MSGMVKGLRLDQSENLNDDFSVYWEIAARHVYGSVSTGRYLRDWLTMPMFEHLSFYVGNKLFFVYLNTPVTPFEGDSKVKFISVSLAADAIPCVLHMGKKGSEIFIDHINGGNGLFNALTGERIVIESLINGEVAFMSDWELKDYGAQLATKLIEESGGVVVSKSVYLGLHPSIWYEKDGKSHFVVISVLPLGTSKEMPKITEVELAVKERIFSMDPHVVPVFFAAVLWCAEEEFMGSAPIRGRQICADTRGLEVF